MVNKKRLNILITSAGRRVELVQAFQESLRRYVPSGKVYTTDLNPLYSAACQLSDLAFKTPAVNSPDYVESLIDLCISHDIGLIIPTIDTELSILSKFIGKFKEIGTDLVISDYQLVFSCRDKRLTADLFTELGIDYPKIFDPNFLTFPCFCKPYDGSCSAGAFPLLSEDMLNDEIQSDKKNIFMELIDSDYTEYTIDAYYSSKGELRCIVPRERIEVRGGEVSKGVTRKNYVYNYMLDKLSRIKGARGCLTVQVFYNSTMESIKGLEVNPRFGGGFPLAYAAGAKYPEWLILEYFYGETIGFFDEWEDGLTMLRYDAKVLVRKNENQ